MKHELTFLQKQQLELAQKALPPEVRHEGEALRADGRQELGAALELPEQLDDGQRHRNQIVFHHLSILIMIVNQMSIL